MYLTVPNPPGLQGYIALNTIDNIHLKILIPGCNLYSKYPISNIEPLENILYVVGPRLTMAPRQRFSASLEYPQVSSVFTTRKCG